MGLLCAAVLHSYQLAGFDATLPHSSADYLFAQAQPGPWLCLQGTCAGAAVCTVHGTHLLAWLGFPTISSIILQHICRCQSVDVVVDDSAQDDCTHSGRPCVSNACRSW